jgi:hypothetical protein
MTNIFITVAAVIAVVVLAVSIIDLSIGLFATLVSDVFGAMRRHRRGMCGSSYTLINSPKVRRPDDDSPLN